MIHCGRAGTAARRRATARAMPGVENGYRTGACTFGSLSRRRPRGTHRLPFTGHRPDHRAGIELAAIDAHRAAEAAADIERRSMMVLRARRGGTGSKWVTFRGGRRRAIRSSSGRLRGVRCSTSYGTNRSCRHVYCAGKRGSFGLIHPGRHRAAIGRGRPGRSGYCASACASSRWSISPTCKGRRFPTCRHCRASASSSPMRPSDSSLIEPVAAA